MVHLSAPLTSNRLENRFREARHSPLSVDVPTNYVTATKKRKTTADVVIIESKPDASLYSF